MHLLRGNVVAEISASEIPCKTIELFFCAPCSLKDEFFEPVLLTTVPGAATADQLDLVSASVHRNDQDT
jgi:hypothetical protein